MDDFGVKYVVKENEEHLIRTIKQAGYELSEDWAGTLYYGITLDWHYKEGFVEISIPHYIERFLLRFRHEMPKRPQDCPYKPPQKPYGTSAQKPVPEDTSEHVTRIRIVRQVVGCVFWDWFLRTCAIMFFWWLVGTILWSFWHLEPEPK